jgi:hypothetical protein
MPAVSHTTKKEVLRRAKILVSESHADLRNRTFIVCDSPEPRDELRDKVFATISIPGGQWNHSHGQGGVLQFVGTLSVTLWVQDGRDRVGEDQLLLLGAGGIYDLETAIIEKLTFSSLEMPEHPDEILTEPLLPAGVESVVRNIDEALGGSGHRSTNRAMMTMGFSFAFHQKIPSGDVPS